MMLDPNSNRFTYAYDPAGRLASLVNPEGDRTTFSYDAAGERTRQLQANGVSTSYTYDAAGRLTQLASYNPAGTPLTSFDYRYDSAANRTGVTEVDGTLTTWTYDRTYQLTAEHRGGTYHATYTYDPVGNRLVKNDSGALTTSTYDAANQLQTSQDASGTTNYVYDGAGNLRTTTNPAGGITTHTWDDENRRTRVALPSGVVNTSTYNGDGLRVTRQDSTGTTNFIWDGQAYLLEYTDTDVTIFTQEPSQYGGLVSQAHADFANYIYVPHYYLHDALGSTAKLTDAAAHVTDSYLYKAFGEILQSSGTTRNPFLWVGSLGYYADLDLLDYYLRARVYRPAIGRFLSLDPIGYVAGDINLYRYGANGSVIRVDPSGRAFGDWPCWLRRVVCGTRAHQRVTNYVVSSNPASLYDYYANLEIQSIVLDVLNIPIPRIRKRPDLIVATKPRGNPKSCCRAWGYEIKNIRFPSQVALKQLDSYLNQLKKAGIRADRGDANHLGLATGSAWLTVPDCGLMRYNLTQAGLIQYYWAKGDDCLGQEDPKSWFPDIPEAPMNWAPLYAVGGVVAAGLVVVTGGAALIAGAGVGALGGGIIILPFGVKAGATICGSVAAAA